MQRAVHFLLPLVLCVGCDRATGHGSVDGASAPGPGVAPGDPEGGAGTPDGAAPVVVAVDGGAASDGAPPGSDLGASDLALPPSTTPWQWLRPLPQGDQVLRLFRQDSALYAFTAGWAFYRSLDGGQSWSRWSALAGQLGADWPGIAMDAWADPTGAWFAIGQGHKIARSTDGGRTFSTLPVMTFQNLFAVWGSSGLDVYVVGSDSVLHTFDGGDHWDERKPLIGGFTAVWGSAPEDVLFGGDSGRVLRSTDYGMTFVQKTVGLGSQVRGFFGRGSERWAVGDFGTLLYSSDAGETWSKEPLPSGFQLDLFAGAVVGSDLYAVGAQGAVLHRGASAWETVASGTTLTLTAAVDTPAALLAGGLDGALVRGQAGAPLTVLVPDALDPLTRITDAVSLGPGRLCAVQSDGSVLRTDDAGASFTVTRPTTQPLYGAALGAADEVYVAGANALVMRSTDGCATFSTVGHPGLNSDWLSAVWAAPDGHVFVHQQDMYIVYVSADHGASFTTANFSGATGGDGVWGDGAGKVWAGGGYSVFASIDWGTTWKETYVGIQTRSIWGTAGGELYASGGPDSCSIARSSDGGATFTLTNDPAHASGYGGCGKIWGSSRDDVYVGGGWGIVVHSTDRGASWPREDTTSASTLGVVGSSAGEVFAFGSGILVRR
jgi:photosystem II stability/assembly factor-like uncharacterized protein